MLTSGPRATFTRTASWRIAARAAASIKSWVSGVSGAATTTASDWASCRAARAEPRFSELLDTGSDSLDQAQVGGALQQAVGCVEADEYVGAGVAGFTLSELA